MSYSKKKADAIRNEIARLDDPGSPERCCCIHVACSEENGHERGQCKNRPGATVWKGRVEWFCLTCREYQYGGSKAGGGPRTS